MSMSIFEWCKLNNREDILQEWDFSSNNKAPENVGKSSNIKYSWICNKCKYKWKANPNSRTRGTGCPKCAGKIVIKGENDFLSKYPHLAEEWDYSKNEKNPNEYSVSSAKKVYWIGKCGHHWSDTIAHRTNRNSNCPICYNQIRTSFPEQAIFFYVKKHFPDAVNSERDVLNGKELDIYIPSRKIAIEYDGQAWHSDKDKDEMKNKLCQEKGIVLYRIREQKCWFWPETEFLKMIPCVANNINELENAIKLLLTLISNNYYIDININRDSISIRNQFLVRQYDASLENVYPNIAAEWNYIKNGELTPKMVKCKSASNVWWIDKLGHEWQARVYSRVTGEGCPYCSKPARKVLAGFNDLLTLYPNIANQWDYTSNNTSPSNVLPGTKEKYFWICPTCNNKYSSSPAMRCKGTGCPKCGHKITNQSKYIRIKNVDTNEEFSSVKVAAEKYNLASSNIVKCCQGKRSTCGGYHWEYLK